MTKIRPPRKIQNGKFLIKWQFQKLKGNNCHIHDLVQVFSNVENGGLIKETVVYRCSKIINQLRENKSRLQTKTEVNTSTITIKPGFMASLTSHLYNRRIKFHYIDNDVSRHMLMKNKKAYLQSILPKNTLYISSK